MKNDNYIKEPTNDQYDQKICFLARKAGYDTVIFQMESGEKRPNTEILDVRDREKSYNSICIFEVDDLHYHNLASQSKYPTIWYPSYGLLTPS